MSEIRMQDLPLIVQSYRTILLDVHSPYASQCRDEIMAFAELIKAPEHVHTYSISAISLWNAKSAGLNTDQILERLDKWSKFPIPQPVESYVQDVSSRFGKLVLEPYSENSFVLKISDLFIAKAIMANQRLSKLLRPVVLENEPKVSAFEINQYERGDVKLALIKLGYPVDDRVPLVKSEHIPIEMKCELRDYQKEAVHSLLGDLGPGTGYGTIVMPCGSKDRGGH